MQFSSMKLGLLPSHIIIVVVIIIIIIMLLRWLNEACLYHKFTRIYEKYVKVRQKTNLHFFKLATLSLEITSGKEGNDE